MNALDVLYCVAAVVTAPIWARKARGDWRGRFGHAEPLPPVRAEGTAAAERVLLHAVSVGEVNALRALVPMLRSGGAEVIVSVGTDTGIARARELFESAATPERSRAVVVRYPLDFSRSVRRFLDAIQPSVVALVELEVWPNFIRECGRRGTPVMVINGRLSSRSFRGYRRVRGVLRRTFASLQLAAVQDEAYASRFIEMGVAEPRCVVTGSMKWDAAKIEEPPLAGAAALANELGIDPAHPLIVAGSTGPDEEALLHRACLLCGPRVQLLCAPRKPERFDEAAAGMPGCVRRSTTKHHGPDRSVASDQGEAGGRFLLDTIGELRTAYSLADVVVVGRSFGNLYGSDPIEPIGLGKATLIGPRFGDFESIVGSLVRAGGMAISTPGSIAADIRGLLADPGARGEMSRRGRECIVENQGATRRHADLILNALRDVAAP